MPGLSLPPSPSRRLPRVAAMCAFVSCIPLRVQKQGSFTKEVRSLSRVD